MVDLIFAFFALMFTLTKAIVSEHCDEIFPIDAGRLSDGLSDRLSDRPPQSASSYG